MIPSNFDLCLERVLRYEGGLVDHPADPGGRTNKGITQRKMNEVRAAHPELALPEKVDDLTDAQIGAIYRLEYWDRCSCDELPLPVAMLVFDAAVNAGVGRAPKWLQFAARVKVDGVVGSQTIAAVLALPLPVVINEFCSRWAWHYMTLDSLDDTFGLGWSRRLMDIHSAAILAAQEAR